MSRLIVIDTDPGIDDAVAVLLALQSAEFEIRGITTVAGNIGIATTTRNAGRILALAGRSDIPVLTGASGPLSRKGSMSPKFTATTGWAASPFPSRQDLRRPTR